MTDPFELPSWSEPLPSGDDEGAEFTLPPGVVGPDAPLSPIERMRRGDTDPRVG